MTTNKKQNCTQKKWIRISIYSNFQIPQPFAIQKHPYRDVLKKRVLEICSKFKGEHQCRNVISIKLLYNFIKIALRQECSPANLKHFFEIPFPKNTSGWLILAIRLISTLSCLFYNKSLCNMKTFESFV